ncbi:DarT1-associated NADAR antitoxin family protein [Paraburkholderia sejongensis]|nr:hypothetical protein [Paraburkholderia sp. MMS20-SJTR3]
MIAQRPVYIPSSEGPLLVHTVEIQFEWFAGLSVSQKQRSIDALHTAAQPRVGSGQVLEISTKSRQAAGIAASAFNLKLRMPVSGCATSVESAFQGSKVFENGGPYTDILAMSSVDAKRDQRIKNSGRLTGFRFMNEDWPLEPRTAFYDWLFISALLQNPALAGQLRDYCAFTDIEFNPARSINCQAYSAALFVALSGRGKLTSAALDQATFFTLLADYSPFVRDAGAGQASLF